MRHVVATVWMARAALTAWAVCIALAAPVAAFENVARKPGVIASGVNLSGSDAAWLIDGVTNNSNARAQHLPGGHLLITLDKAYLVSEVKTALALWTPGEPATWDCEYNDYRKFDWYLEVSEDGNSWTQIGNYVATPVNQWISTTFAQRLVKFVRTTGTKLYWCHGVQPDYGVMLASEQEVWGDPAVPEMAVTSITVDPASPTAGQQATYTATLTNSGNADYSYPSECCLGIDGVPTNVAWSGFPLTIPAGQSRTISTTYTFPTAGAHTVKLLQNAGGFSDANAGNDVYTLNVSVAEAPAPDLVVDDMRMLDQPVAGQTTRMDMLVRNSGSAPTTGSWTYRIYVNGSQVHENFSTSQVAVGQTVSPGWDPGYTFPSAGSYQVKGEVLSVSGEQITTNNSKEVTVTVAGIGPADADWANAGPSPHNQYTNIAGPYYLPITVTGQAWVQSSSNGDRDKGWVFISRNANYNSADGGQVFGAFSAEAGYPDLNYWFQSGQQNSGDIGAMPSGQWVPFTLTFKSDGILTHSLTGVNASMNVPMSEVNAMGITQWHVALGSSTIASQANRVAFKGISVQGGPAPAPDVEVSSISFTPSSPRAGENTSIQPKLKNVGSAPTSGSFEVKYFVNDVLKATEQYSLAIAAGAEATTGWSYSFPSQGSHNVRVEVANVSGEAVTTNNSKTAGLTVDDSLKSDIVVSNPGYSPQNPYVGQKIAFSLTKKNEGDTMAPYHKHRLYVNDVEVGQAGAGAMIVGQTGGWDANEPTWSPTAAGQYTIKLAVTDIENEANTGNNEATLQITVSDAPKPDLVIKEIVTDPASPVAGQEATIKINFANQGSADTPASSFHLWSNGNFGNYPTIPAIPAGGNAVVDYKHTFTSSGNFEVVADLGNPAAISPNDPPRTLTATVTVSAAPTPDLAVTSITFEPTQPVTGQSAVMKVAVKNVGSADTASYSIHMRIPSDPSMSSELWTGRTVTKSLAKGASTVIEEPVTFTVAGSKIARAWVSDGEGALAANNEKTVEFTVLAAPKPDITLTNLYSEAENVYATKIADLVAAYKNDGDLASGEFKIKFFSGATEIGEKTISSVAAGAAGEATLEYTFAAAADVTLKAAASSVTGEAITDNNEKTASITVLPPPPEGALSLDKTEIDYGTLKTTDVIPAKAFVATIDGGKGNFDLTVASNASWFKTDVEKDMAGKVAMPRTGGEYNQTVGIVSVDIGKLSDGQHTSVVTTSAPDPIGSKEVTVKVKVENPLPVVSVKTTKIDLGSYKAGEAIDARSFEIENIGKADLEVTEIAPGATWIAADPTKIAQIKPGEKKEVTLTFTTEKLSEGAKSGKMTVKSNGGDDQKIEVLLEIIAADAAAELSLSEAELDFGAIELDQTAKSEKTFVVRNKGGGTLSWNLAMPAEAPWLTASPTSATHMAREQEVKLTLDPAKFGKGDTSVTVKVSDTSTPPTEYSLTVKASGVALFKAWDLDLRAGQIEADKRKLSAPGATLEMNGGAKLDIKVEMTAANRDAGLAPKAAVAKVFSWRPGNVTSVGDLTGTAEERLTYTETVELPARWGVYYVALVMGGVENADEAAGFDNSVEHGGKGQPIGNGNDVWDLRAGDWEGAVTNGFFAHDLNGDGQDRKWPAIVIKVKVKGKTPGKRRLADGDITITRATFGGQPIEENKISVAGETEAKMFRVEGIARYPAGDGGDGSGGGARIGPAGSASQAGAAPIRVMAMSTMFGGAGEMLDLEIPPGEEKRFVYEKTMRPPGSDGVFYIGFVAGRADELAELRSNGLARNDWEEGISKGRAPVILTINENEPKDFAVRAIRLVTKQPPKVKAEPAALVMIPNADEGFVEGRVKVSNISGGLLDGNATAGEAWIEVRPQAFAGNEVELFVRANIADLLRVHAARSEGKNLAAVKSGMLYITTSGGEIEVPLSADLSSKGAIPEPGSVEILPVKAEGPFPELKWQSKAKPAEYTLVVADAKTGKIGWTTTVRATESRASAPLSITYAGFPLIPAREYVVSIRHESWPTPVESRFTVANYKVGW